jgi:diketogulonate reductase-like aldo/keto reductase
MKSFQTLSNGVKIPNYGFGTWQISDGAPTYDAVRLALNNGFCHIDTVNAYENEKSVGRAIRDSGIKREEIFVTSKLPAEIKSYSGTQEFFAKTMDNLGLDKLDLYLIHAPWPWSEMGADYSKQNLEVWRAFEEFYADKKVRAIGISSFEVKDIQNILSKCSIKPMVNQLKFFIGFTQEDIVKFCQQNEIVVVGFSTLGTGSLLDNKEIAKVAEKYGVSLAHLAIRYSLQRNVVPLVKSTKQSHMIPARELDFKISDEDILYLNNLTNTVSVDHGPKRKD